jgi:hypothetical protein
MKESARYVKVVGWSEEDQCYVGSAPGLIFGGCHGDDEREVFEELCRVVDEAIDLYKRQGKPLPPPTSGRDLANQAPRVV